MPGDPFRFMPCPEDFEQQVERDFGVPALDDSDPETTWVARFDTDPSHWRWGGGVFQYPTADLNRYAGRGIFLCGYLDVPLDYTNDSDPRIARIAVNKYQASGLVLSGDQNAVQDNRKSGRTIVVNPGGPGGSGVILTFNAGESISMRFSGGQFDVLGFDPRGVSQSLPSFSCAPCNADRQYWTSLMYQVRDAVNPRVHLGMVDAMNDAILKECWKANGDVGRFMSTAFVARDMERIRQALNETELTGAFYSYGTELAQTYANMFPQRVGRMSLDSIVYARDSRELHSRAWANIDNTTDVWDDGFLGECIHAGPENCALAQPVNGTEVTLSGLKSRIQVFLKSLLARPIPTSYPTTGPAVITYSALVGKAFNLMYNPRHWPALAAYLSQLERGETEPPATTRDTTDPGPTPPGNCSTIAEGLSRDVNTMVVCADSSNSPPHDDLDWWNDLWAKLSAHSWLAGNIAFYAVFQCRQFRHYWPDVAETYRADFNQPLKHPLLLVSGPYDPVTPLRSARRLLGEMGGENARLVVNHGFGHASPEPSACLDALLKAYFLNGSLPEERETACYADGRPYMYGNGIVVVPGSPL